MQKKKIYDIIPIRERSDANSFQSGQNNSKSIDFLFEKKNQKPIKSKKDSGSFFLIMIGLILLAMASIYVLVDPKLEIKIKPKISEFQVNAKVLCALSQNDKNALFIPLQELEVSQNLAQEMAVSKKDGSQKARGVITLYNEYSNQAESFVLGTKFVDADGKIFSTLEKVVVPGKKANGDPGTANVKVEAIEAGAQYNIAPTTFSIPKLRSTVYYTKFYGKSAQAMKGGSDGEVFSLSQDDIDAAKKMLEDKAYEKAKDYLTEKYPGYEILVDSIDYKAEYPDYSKELGSSIDKFICQGTVKINGLGIKKNDIDDFAKNYIKNNISKQKKTIEKTLKITLSPHDVNTQDKTARLVIDMSIDSYFDIDFQGLKKTILGLKKSDLPEFIMGGNGEKIESVEIDLKPFWRNDAPKKTGDIDISWTGVD